MVRPWPDWFLQPCFMYLKDITFIFSFIKVSGWTFRPNSFFLKGTPLAFLLFTWYLYSSWAMIEWTFYNLPSSFPSDSQHNTECCSLFMLPIVQGWGEALSEPSITQLHHQLVYLLYSRIIFHMINWHLQQGLALELWYFHSCHSCVHNICTLHILQKISFVNTYQ